MARPRTPTKVLELKGAFKKNPQRKRKSEPRVNTPVGEPPKSLKKDELACWNEVVALSPPGVITSADRIAVEIAARLLAEFRKNFEEMPAARLMRLEALLGKFGMTPSDRAKIAAPGDDERNPFEEFV